MLTQAEAEQLIAVEKLFEDANAFVHLPGPDAEITIPLVYVMNAKF